MIKKYILPCFLLFLLTGYFLGSEVSKEEAETIVIETHSNHLGPATIVSSTEKKKSYYIEWENKDDGSGGTDKVSQTGHVKQIQAWIK